MIFDKQQHRKGGQFRRLLQRQDGAAMAEFALVLPLLLLIVTGTLQYGMLMYTYNSMITGARSAARAASLGDQTTAQIETAAKSWLPGFVDRTAVVVTTTALAGDRVQVNVSMPSSKATVLPFVPMPATLDVAAVMANEA